MSANTTSVNHVPMNLDQIQGNVIGFNKPFQTFLFLRFKEHGPDVWRDWLSNIIGDVTTVKKVLKYREDFREFKRNFDSDESARTEFRRQRPGDEEKVWLNLAFTYAGLEALGTLPLDGLPPEFVAGMAARADILGDVEASAPTQWAFNQEIAREEGEERDDSKKVHAVMILAADDRNDLNVMEQHHRGLLAGAGITVLHSQRGEDLAETLGQQARGTEHFGFKDGVSQPGIRNDNVNPIASLQRGQVRICPGEFVLGYPRHDPDEEPGTETKLGTEAEPSPIWTENGSYVVVRQLEQHVAAFNQSVASESARHGLKEELFKAKLVGRYPSGAPLAALKNPAAGANQGPPGAGTDPGPGSPLLDDQHINDFDFQGDSDGDLVPLGAHIRRLHPRDRTAGNRSFIETKRILRRGIPYAHTAEDRGLIFVCYQSSIKDQYEFLQQSWANDPHFPSPGQRSAWPGRDPLIGSGRGEDHDGRRFHIPNSNNVDHASLARWITMKGGDYFFSPSLQALGYLITGQLHDAVVRRRDEAARRQLVAERTRDIAESRHTAAERMQQDAGDDLRDAVAEMGQDESARGDMHGQQAAARRKADVERRQQEAEHAVKETRRKRDAAKQVLEEARRKLGTAERVLEVARRDRGAAEQMMSAEAREANRGAAASQNTPYHIPTDTITGEGDCKLQVTVAFNGLDQKYYYPWRVWVRGEPVWSSQRSEYIVPNSHGFATGTMWMRLVRLLEALDPGLTAGRIVQKLANFAPPAEVLGAYTSWEVELITRTEEEVGPGEIAALFREDTREDTMKKPRLLHKDEEGTRSWAAERIGIFFPIDMVVPYP